MKHKLTASLFLLLLNLGYMSCAQGIIDNEYFSVKIPEQLKLQKEEKGVRSYMYNTFTLVYSEIDSKESGRSNLRGYAKYVFDPDKGYYRIINLNGYQAITLIEPNIVDGYPFVNELIALDNSLHNIPNGRNKIFSFVFSYPKQDSSTYAGIINSIKSSIEFKSTLFTIEPWDTKAVVTVVAPTITFGFGQYKRAVIQTPFINNYLSDKGNVDFAAKDEAFEQVVKSEKSDMKGWGFKEITVTETTMNGYKTTIIKGNIKNKETKECDLKTVYIIQAANKVWTSEYVLNNVDCMNPISDAKYKAIIESVRIGEKK